jgi:hypothetical protein
VINLGGGVFEGRPNIVRFKVRKISEYLFFGSTAGEHIENIFDADSHTANAWTPATLTWVRGDSI